MITIYVDNEPHQVEEGVNLLHACLSLGFNLPFFCWHPAMHSVGACRQCAVKQFKDEKDTRGRIVMSCMTPATEGARISIDDPDARAFRARVIEWLMVNHPHDCPVCDEGSECHLQDMTVMTGHDYRRYRFKKRTYRDQYLGPFLHHEMNRCIQCYRCVRYYRDYAGGRDLDVFGVHDRVYFGRHEDGTLENEFSGNLVEVCPTGVFTDETFRSHYTRKWDLQTAPSVCVHCSLGCNTIPGERYSGLRRIRNRYNGEVNGYFLCDRGRFGYEFVNSKFRIREPVYHNLDHTTPAAPAPSAADPKAEALQRLAAVLKGSTGAIGIGSPRASLEANFALRTLVGPERFYLGMSEGEARPLANILEVLGLGPAPSASLRQVRESDAVLVLGEDVTNYAPVLALALRQSVRQQPLKIAQKLKIPQWHDAAVREAIQQATGPLFIATVTGTKLDEIATQVYHAAPEDIARLGFAVAQIIADVGAGVPAGPPSATPDQGGQGRPPLQGEVQTLAEAIAQALQEAEKPLVVSGTSLGSVDIVKAAANVAWALQRNGRPARLCFTAPECNSMGLSMLGGGSLAEAFRAVEEGLADTVIVLENDLYRRADAPTVDAFLERAGHVIAIDYLASPTTEKAEAVLPAATFAESDGTLVNNEGRAQRFFQLFVPTGYVQESWRWLRDLMVAAGRREPGRWENLDQLTADLVQEMPALGPVAEIAPPADFRMAGQKIARQHQRFSGRTAIYANVDVSEPKPPEDPDSALTFSMEGYAGQPPAALTPRFWAPGWNSIQSLTRFQEEVNGPLRGGDPGKRLREPAEGEEPPTAPEMPAPFQRQPGKWLLAPLYHIFGSEEMSSLSPPVASLIPRIYLGLNAQDAATLGLSEGENVELMLGGMPRSLAIKIIPTLPQGVAGVPAGLPGMEGIILPVWSTFIEQEASSE